jgi:hypothetical protein
VEVVNFIQLRDSREKLILVEWSSGAAGRKNTSVYRMEDGGLKNDLEENTVTLLVYDLDGDGYDDIIYITEQAGVFELKCVVDISVGSDIKPAAIALNKGMRGYISLTAGYMSGGMAALFVDGSVSAGADQESGEAGEVLKATEVFIFENGRFKRVEPGIDIFEATQRPLDYPSCSKIYGDSRVFIPMQAPPPDIEPSDEWTYWYAVEEDGMGYASGGYVCSDQNYGFVLNLPRAWLSGSSVIHEDRSRRWEIYGLGVENEPIVSLVVLTVGEQAKQYGDEGYELIKQSGSYRFYMKNFAAGNEDYGYIRDNFFVL